jgi:pimeloyl-ACP methyl ester carboxylesterase
MNPTATGGLAAPGATLYYEIRGTGPALLLIPGGGGEATVYTTVADALAGRHTVISYDRRGFGRSALDAPLDDAARLPTDADDAARLLDELAGGRGCVFGNSSGAIVGLELLARHPDRVETLVAHEPPLLCVLPDGDRYLRLLREVYETWRRDGVEPAMQRFTAGLGVALPPRPPQEAELAPHVRELLARARRNREFWLEHEMRQYAAATPDLAALRAASARLVLANGSGSRGSVPYRPALALADRLSLAVAEFPGDHVGFLAHPAAFAERLAGVLDRAWPPG